MMSDEHDILDGYGMTTVVPDTEDDEDDTFEFTTRKLFLKYDDDEWDDGEIGDVVQTINSLFGRDTQLVVMNDSLEFMGSEDVQEFLSIIMEDVIDERHCYR